MSVEFIDTNILIYAHEGGAGVKHTKSVELISRLFEAESGALSTQVLVEFYAAATKKLLMPAEEAEAAISDLGGWTIHRPGHADLLQAAKLARRHKFSWWDALVVQSAIALGCKSLWTEDLKHGQRVGGLTVRNPFA